MIPNKLYVKREYAILASAIAQIWYRHFIDVIYEGYMKVEAS